MSDTITKIPEKKIQIANAIKIIKKNTYKTNISRIDKRKKASKITV
jgi:hypothetical protein